MLKLVNLVKFIFVVLLFIVFSKQVFATNYYVSPSGNDANAGTQTSPWQHIQKSADTMIAGDTAYLRTGTYNEKVTPKNSGTAGNYITYTAYTGETATIDGTGINIGDFSGLIHIASLNYIKISGLRVINANFSSGTNHQYGIYALCSNNITVEKNYVANTNSAAIASDIVNPSGVNLSCTPNNITIDSNEVNSTNSSLREEAIFLAFTNSFEVKNNNVHNSQKEGIDVLHGSFNGSIHNNTVHDNAGLGIYVDAWDQHTYGIDVYNNISYNNNGGFALSSENGGLLENIRLFNNIAYSNHNDYGFVVSNWDQALTSQHPMNNISLINNTSFNNSGDGFRVMNPQATNVILRNNISSQNTNQIAITVSLTNLTIDHNLVFGSSSYLGSSIAGDPKFVNTTSFDFHLQTGSPAIDTGSAAAAPGFDFAGNARPYGAGYDVGAYEYGSTVTPTPGPSPTPIPTTPITPSPTPPPGSGAIAINTGSTTSYGSFIADTNYSGGNSYTSTNTIDTSKVTNPAPMQVYQSERFGNFTYTIPNLTPNASYNVRLHFAEIFFTSSGQRLFNVSINSVPVLSNFDIYAQAGGANIAVIKEFTTNANSSGQIIIAFTNGLADNAKIDGIEVVGSGPTSTPTPTPVPVGNGDANGDGVVNTKDIQATVSKYGQVLGLPTDQYGDSYINMLDTNVPVLKLTVPTSTPIPTNTPLPTNLPTPTGPTATPAPISAEWPMAAANPQRTSHNSVEVPGNLSVDWYHVIDPYIDNKTQVIATAGKILLATSKGLFAFDATTGCGTDCTKPYLWVYGTELPVSTPTVANNIVYLPGFNHRIQALDINTGIPISGYTPYEAGAGFETNPLVINDSFVANTILAGNRDGNFYALDAVTGAKKWSYTTGGPIRFSAAYKNGIVYFASDDSYAYALNVANGSLKWKSVKLPGVGFEMYWPVLYTDSATNKDYAIFSGTKKAVWGWWGYPDNLATNMYHAENYYIFNGISGCPSAGGNMLDCSVISNYFAGRPYKRHFFVFDASSGQELTNPYPPMNWAIVTKNGDKHPPVVGGDGWLYTGIGYNAGGNSGANGSIAGWQFGTSLIKKIDNFAGAADEPIAFSSGGNLIYFFEGVNGDTGFDGTLDITKPIGSNYSSWQNPLGVANASAKYTSLNLAGKFGGNNGVYLYFDGITNQTPVPYNNKLYLINGNVLFALSAAGGVKQLPTATAGNPAGTNLNITASDLQTKLSNEVQKILAAGHLRPGFMDSGLVGGSFAAGNPPTIPGNHLNEYFTTPGETLATLASAIPFLSPTPQAQVKQYLQNEESNVNSKVETIAHIGWRNGAQRELFDDPPEIAAVADRTFGDGNGTINGISVSGANLYVASDPRTTIKIFCSGPTDPFCMLNPGTFPPDAPYGAWKYAVAVGLTQPQASTLYNSMTGKLMKAGVGNDMTDANLIKYPYILNQYIDGYRGYLELEKLAGVTTDITKSTQWCEFARLVSLRLNNFSENTPLDNTWNNNNVLNVARNFMYMTPELANYMINGFSTTGSCTYSAPSVQNKVQTAITDYQIVEPFWFVSKYDRTYDEGIFHPLHGIPALFQTKAYVLKQPLTELVKYLDQPAFAVGDLYYIQNLVAALQAP